MNISLGLKITDPDLFIPWNINTKQLKTVFEGHDIKYVTDTYYTIGCEMFNSLNCILGFHFQHTTFDRILEFEFFRTNYSEQEKSFDEFQFYFVQEFGPPTNIKKGNEGFNNYEWLLDDIKIIHLVYNRFGSEEHMRIIKYQ